MKKATSSITILGGQDAVAGKAYRNYHPCAPAEDAL